MPPETAPVSTYVVHQWNCDHFGHLNARHYAAAFDDAIFVFWSRMGQCAGEGRVFPVSLEIRIGFKHEALAGIIADITAQIVKVGQKSVGLQFEMRDRVKGTLLATCDVVEVFMDPATRKSCEIPADVKARLIENVRSDAA